MGQTLAEAARQDKKAIVLFRRPGTGPDELEKSFDSIKKELETDALFLAVDANSPAETAAARKYEVESLTESALLILSPQGTVLAGYTKPPEPAEARKVIVSKALAAYTDAIEKFLLVFVVVGKPGTKDFDKAQEMAKTCAAEVPDGKGKVITVDGSDPAEAAVLERFSIGPREPKPITCVFGQGNALGKLEGVFSAADVKKLLDAASCGSG
ncbi:MAG: hypothetical protein RDV41_10220 [Planctomycetota bacterium]|nr:hypothetical protein [Planctomycetota bacterium]